MTLTILSEIRSSRLREISAYLDSKRRPGRKLRRSDLDPITEIPRLSAYLTLVEQIEPQCYRVRLCGSVVAEILGHDITGLILDNRPPHAASDWDTTLDEVFRTDGLLSGTGSPVGPGRSHVVFEWIAQLLAVGPDAAPMAIAALDQQPGQSLLT